jgi:predicted Rossmann fold flavoprotein
MNSNKNTNYDLLVIGGGAAGLLGAITAAERGLRVLLLEKGPKLGRKILISGGGRCNVTNNKHSNTRDFLANYPRGNKFLWSAFSRFNQNDLMNWFTARGLKLKTEEDGRVFPVSNNSQDVMNTLEESALKDGIEIKTNHKVTSLLFNDEKTQVKGVELEGNKTLNALNIAVTCGGMSYQKTGSSGDAYNWAVEAGHTVVKPKASLTGLVSSASWVHELKGVSLPDIQLSLYCNGQVIAKENGALLFTHWGVSGPAVFKITSLAAGSDYTQGEFVLKVNFFPSQKRAAVTEMLKLFWKENPKRKTINCLDGILTNRLEKTILELSAINTNKTFSELSNAESERLTSLLTELAIPINQTRPSGEEIVTAGGICLDEINPTTMESKIVKGLYWAGEILDIDGFTGGYNLQAAWSTGWLLGQSVEAQ